MKWAWIAGGACVAAVAWLAWTPKMRGGRNSLTKWAPGKSFSEGKLDRMPETPRCIILHHTGSGVLDRADEWGVHPDVAALHIYGSVIDFSPHYVVGETGIYQVTPETHKAWHAGLGEHRQERLSYYASGATPRDYEWWANRWPGKVNPRDLLPGGVGGNRCIGIELVAVPEGQEFSRATYENLKRLLRDLSRRLNIPLDRNHVLGHSDIDPKGRSYPLHSWDPPPHFRWGEVWGIA